MENHQLINATSGAVEYYTPQPIIEAARATMGKICLDPASSPAANDRVRADAFLFRDGLNAPWACSALFMNHPFSREENAFWINKLVSECEAGHVDQACCITFACTSEKWFRPLLYYPQCFLYPRTNYLLPDGTVKRGVTKGSVVTYLGPNIADFAANFAKLGAIKVAF